MVPNMSTTELQIERPWVKGDFERALPVPTKADAREARCLQVLVDLGKRYASTANQYCELLVRFYGEEKDREWDDESC